MSEGKFYTPEEVKPLYGEIIPAYQAAFAGKPWEEVSKCADQRQRCVGGLSTVAVGSLCSLCGQCPERPAYEADELIARFDALAVSRPTMWYGEQTPEGLAMAAVAWKETPAAIVQEKYQDVPEMTRWISEMIGESPIVWLDEVFANRQIRSAGNLRNFGDCVTGLAQQLGSEMVAYRTIVPQMTWAAQRDFGSAAAVLRREAEVPDRRDFVIITMGREQ